MSDLHVIFGTGPVGRALMRDLLGRGEQIRAVNRSGQGDFPTAVELVAGDASKRGFAREAAAGASVVYQCASPPYHRWPELFPRLQAGVVEGAAAAGARLVALENVYMYGSPYGRPLTERRPMTATTKKGRLRAELAEELMQAHRKGRVAVAIGRASDFFGPEVTESAVGARVFRPALRGEPVDVLGNTKLPHTYSYVPDIARGLAILGHRDEAIGEVWHLPGPETVTTAEFVAMVFAETGHPPNVRRVGKATLRMLGFFNPRVRELVEMMYQFEEPFVVEHTKFAETFGDIATPLTEAIRATVAWYRQQEPAEEPDERVAKETSGQGSDENGMRSAESLEQREGKDGEPDEVGAATDVGNEPSSDEEGADAVAPREPSPGAAPRGEAAREKQQLGEKIPAADPAQKSTE